MKSVPNVLRKLRDIPLNDNRSARLKEGERHDTSGDPWLLQDRPQFKLLALLRGSLAGGRVGHRSELRERYVVAPVEDGSHHVRGDIHEDGDPKYSSELANVLHAKISPANARA